MQLNTDFLEQWEKIINDVDKDHCPIACVRKVIFKTRDRKQKTINLRSLRDQGIDDESIEAAVSNFITENEDNIANMELIVDVEAVVDLIQPETDRLLKGM